MVALRVSTKPQGESVLHEKPLNGSQPPKTLLDAENE